MPELADRPERWPVAGSRDLHRDDWIMALRADDVRRPGGADGQGVGEPFSRWVLEHPGAAVVLAVDDDERVLCLWQYRHAAGQRFVELPAGLIDHEGEEPLNVARRELVEETGWQASEWTHLTSVWSSPGISAELSHLYLARGLSEVGRGDFEPEHEEAEMSLGWVPFDDVAEAVLDGRLRDAPLVIAILVARSRGLAGSASASGTPGGGR